MTNGTFKNLPDSFVQCDSPEMGAAAVRVTAIDETKCQLITAIEVQTGDRVSVESPDKDRIHFPLVRGDYLIVTANAPTANADAVVEMGEQI